MNPTRWTLSLFSPDNATVSSWARNFSSEPLENSIVLNRSMPTRRSIITVNTHIPSASVFIDVSNRLVGFSANQTVRGSTTSSNNTNCTLTCIYNCCSECGLTDMRCFWPFWLTCSQRHWYICRSALLRGIRCRAYRCSADDDPKRGSIWGVQVEGIVISPSTLCLSIYCPLFYVAPHQSWLTRWLRCSWSSLQFHVRV